MGERGASWERQTAQGQIRSTDEGHLNRGRERDTQKIPVSSMKAFELGSPVWLELPL